MQKNPKKVKDLLTAEELAEVNDLRCELLKSVSSMERKYYNEEIYKIINHAKERYYKNQSNLNAAK